SLSCTCASVRVLLVCPAKALLTLKNHSEENGGSPITCTRNTAVLSGRSAWLSGCCTIMGGTRTESVALALRMLPASLDTSAEYVPALGDWVTGMVYRDPNAPGIGLVSLKNHW